MSLLATVKFLPALVSVGACNVWLFHVVVNVIITQAKTSIIAVVTAAFKDFKNGEYKAIMTFAKLARGYMTRYIIDTNANTIDDIKGFNYEGYGFSESMSTKTELVFIR